MVLLPIKILDILYKWVGYMSMNEFAYAHTIAGSTSGVEYSLHSQIHGFVTRGFLRFRDRGVCPLAFQCFLDFIDWLENILDCFVLVFWFDLLTRSFPGVCVFFCLDIGNRGRRFRLVLGISLRYNKGKEVEKGESP